MTFLFNRRGHWGPERERGLQNLSDAEQGPDLSLMTRCVDPVSLVCGQRGSLHGCASPLPPHSLQLLRSAVARSGANLASTSCLPAPRPLYPCTGWSQRREAGGALVEPPRSLRVRWVQWRIALDALCPPDSLFPKSLFSQTWHESWGNTPKTQTPQPACFLLLPLWTWPVWALRASPLQAYLLEDTLLCIPVPPWGRTESSPSPHSHLSIPSHHISSRSEREVTLEGLQANSNA